MIRIEELLPADDDGREPVSQPVDRGGGTPTQDGLSPLESPLIDVNGVAALLTCSTKHVRRMADAGRCPAPIRLGGLVRWHRKTVEDWIAAGCPAVRTARMGGRR